ncbi:MAG: 4-hydroxy-tetrahydrodipicolinate reductase [Thermostichales cyanobacterium BF4_bins_65]
MAIPVIVSGALGKMGREIVKVVAQTQDLRLVGAVSRSGQGEDIGERLGLGHLGIPVTANLQETLFQVAQRKEAAVMVDVTHPSCVYENVRAAMAYGIRPVVGTTGLSAEQVESLRGFAEKASLGCLIIPNFSIGVVLMQQLARQAAHYFDHVEIIELHHNQKADAPSGTALQTAALLAATGKTFNPPATQEKETLAGSRGGQGAGQIPIHSVRLPGLVAHQEVIFGGLGQTLTIRHDAVDRVAYMPGVLLAIRKVMELKHLVYGLEQILI